MKIHFGYLLAIAALAVAGCAAFFSVFGLSQLFAGASLSVIIMASALEFSKIVSASFLHKYWKEVSRVLKIYLTIGVIVLVTVTSAGIYGFLSSAYQKTAANLEVHDGQVGILEEKAGQFQSKIDANKALIESRTKRINQLNDLRNGQESRLSDRRSASATRKDISSANTEIKELNSNIDLLNAENSKLLDSVGHYKMKKLETTSNSKVAGEVGPLKYLAELTGAPMAVIVNYLILLLVFVFDPLAISLVIATTWVFEREKRRVLEDKIPLPVIPDNFVGGNSSDWGSLPLEFDANVSDEEMTQEAMQLSETSFEKEWDQEPDGLWDESEEPSQLEFNFDNPPQEEIADEVIDDSVHEDEIPVIKKPYFDPVIPTGKVERSDIKEIKERERGFSIKIPDSKNLVQRVGNHKLIKKDDDGKL